jgi:ABC-2 type transport system permease protein
MNKAVLNKALLNKYVAFLRVAARDAHAQRGELWGRALMFAVLLYVLGQLWHGVAEAGSPGGYSAARVIWYLAVTEWIVLGVPLVHMQIEEDVRRGDVAYALLRPASYLGSLYAQALGRMLLRLPLLAVVGLLLASALGRGAFPGAAALATAALLGVLSQLVLAALFVLIGVAAFWLGDVLPIYWVAQKLLFVLGGLMLPLELYPELLQRCAAFTPFPSMLSGPATIVLRGSTEPAPLIAIQLVLWLALIVSLTQFALTRAARRLTLNGG